MLEKIFIFFAAAAAVLSCFFSGPAKAAEDSRADRILVAGFESDRMQNGVPAGWELDRKSGNVFLRLERASDYYSLHFFSDPKSSFGIKKPVRVNIAQYPYLNWKWKVTRIPENGDARKSERNDQALQVYVAFRPTGWPSKLNTPIVGYVWDSQTPKGWTGRSPALGTGMIKYVILRNKTDRLGEWYTEKRNVYKDYQQLFRNINSGEPLGPTEGVEFYINSQHTRSYAESYICEVFFSKN